MNEMKAEIFNFEFFKNNYLYIIWFVIYFFFTWLMFGASLLSFFIVAFFYLISLTIAFSEVGEKILRFTSRVRVLETKREKHYLIPLFEDVYTDAMKKYPDLAKDIDICIIDAMYINACALGRKTVAVTKGAIESLSEEELKGFIAHELGHIHHGDTKALLLTTVGNGIFTILIIASELVVNVLDRVFGRGGIAGFFTVLLKIWFSITLFFLVYLGQFILSINSRKNEYGADQFAFDIGYGDNLVSGLYLLQDMYISDNVKLVERLRASHPHIAKRIGRLEMMIDTADSITGASDFKN